MFLYVSTFNHCHVNDFVRRWSRHQALETFLQWRKICKGSAPRGMDRARRIVRNLENEEELWKGLSKLYDEGVEQRGRGT